MTRIVIYPKDVEVITGRSERYARHILSGVRKKYGKQKHQLVSVSEFCDYTGLKFEDIADYLQ